MNHSENIINDYINNFISIEKLSRKYNINKTF